jgi:basic membrane protein A
MVMVFGLVACGSSTSTETASDATTTEETTAAETTSDAAEEAPAEAAETTEAADLRVAMITDYGDITDQSFNQTTYEACKAYCEANNVQFLLQARWRLHC